jgi:hypothetical protein
MANAYPFGDFDRKKTSLFLIVSNLGPGKVIIVFLPQKLDHHKINPSGSQ